MKLSELAPNPKNPRKISDDRLEALKKSLEKFGDLSGIIYNQSTKRLVGGHQRGKVLPQDSKIKITKKFSKPSSTGTVALGQIIIGDEIFSYREVHWDEPTELAANIAANKHGGEFDLGLLPDVLLEIEKGGVPLDLTGFDDVELVRFMTGAGNTKKPSMLDKFIVPPFSVLDARQGYWQDRKRDWIALGIQSELGREDTLLGNKTRKGFDGNYDLSKGESAWGGSGSSIFDPVLAELNYRWFCPPKGKILDPFAGGSVRGVVAGILGYEYTGVDLRKEQVQANIVQGKQLCKSKSPRWVAGDSRDVSKLANGKYDFIFSCPPYADLEVYSDDKKDLSTLPYYKFVQDYRKIIKATCDLLKDNRFACFVVGEVREKNRQGNYYNFVGDTVQAFLAAGLRYYNEMILVTSAGSLPLRAGKAFKAGRKIGKSHQNVLVFVKGDPQEATKACGQIEVAFPETTLDPQSSSSISL